MKLSIRKMNDRVKKNRDIILYICVNLLVFIVMFAINTIYPLVWDDKGLVKDFEGMAWTVKDIFLHSFNRYYLHWTGKIVPLTIVSFFTLWDKSIYNVVNSLMYVIFANEIYIIFWKKKYDWKMLSAIYAALWLCIPWFGTVIFWVDGTIEYLWMLIPVLAIGAMYYDKYFGFSDKKRSVIGMFLLGLLAGCGLEATGSALIFGLGVMLIAEFVLKKGIKAWEISGFIGTLIGFGVLMLAPGNYERASTVSDISNIYSNYFYRIGRESFFFVLYMAPLLGVSIALVLMLYRCRKKEAYKADGLWKLLADIYVTCKEPIVIIPVALVSVFVMTFSPAFAARIFLTPTALFIISCGISIRGIVETETGKEIADKYGTVIKTLLFFVCIFVFAQMLMAFICCYYTGEPVTKNIQYTNLINDVRLFY